MLIPNNKQKTKLFQYANTARFAYNWALSREQENYKNGGKYIEQTIKGTEFLRMFLMHVLPKGFVRIRHYGLLSCRNKKEKMTHCRKLLNSIQYISKLRGKTCAEKLMILYKKDICKCEACGGNLHSLSLRGRYMLT